MPIANTLEIPPAGAKPWYLFWLEIALMYIVTRSIVSVLWSASLTIVPLFLTTGATCGELLVTVCCSQSHPALCSHPSIRVISRLPLHSTAAMDSTGNSSTDSQPGPSTDNRPGPSTDNRPGPSTDSRPGPSTDNRPGPSTDSRPAPSADSRPGPSTDSRPGPSWRMDISSPINLPGPSTSSAAQGSPPPTGASSNPSGDASPPSATLEETLQTALLESSSSTPSFTLSIPPAGESPPSSRSHLTVFTFHAAIREHRSVDHIENIRHRLTASPDIQYTMNDALKFAIMYGHSAYSKYLLSHHLEAALLPAVCCPLLLLSVRLDRPVITEQLCYYSRQSKHCKNYINSRGCSAMEFQRTALHVAAEMSSVTVLRILLKYGADISLKDEFNMTPLERLLQRLPAAHLTFNSVRCAWELMQCYPVLQPQIFAAWQKLVRRQPGWQARLDRECRSLCPGPFTLQQSCRCAIRRQLGHAGLPQQVQDLGLPQPLQAFLTMESW